MHTRPYSFGDLLSIAELFHETVHVVGARHYTQEELDAWAPADLCAEDWEARLARNTSLIAEDGGKIVGFAELSPDGAIEMVYVHKDYQGQGIASALLAELEVSAQNDGIERLTANASRVAKSFFMRRGFNVLAAQQVDRRGVRIENFQMEKDLV